LPALATYVARARGISPGFVAVMVAGIGTGIALSIKPHFALAIIPAAVAAAFQAKSWRTPFALEHWIAAGIVAIYGASILVFYPQFIADVLPLVQTVYVPVRVPLFTIITRMPAILWPISIALLAIQQRGAIFQPRFFILLMASCGFALAYLAQGKGWPYHTYPMLALALLALAILPSADEGTAPEAAAIKSSRMDRLASLAIIVSLVGAGFYGMTIAVDFTPLANIIRRTATEPKVIAISSDIGLGHPLVRQVGGEWAQRVGSLWITDNAEWLLKTEKSQAVAAALQRYAARDRAMLLEDIRRGRPDIILLDMRWETRMRSDPALSELLRAYSEVSREEGVIILGRQNREKPR
jgi:4-amino-4-deoxy-L-arabinose transferase-like glycosyltransferase